ncbi:type II toxin-antitoxin system HipA family toxin, partial [Guyparkeria sp. 1SP6A2]|nr:type II toxin-antitoxin system HipA family toxin [Guyparkeria sp. 1SP6A2]
AYMGFGKQPPLKAMQRLATQAGFTDWKQALPYVQETVDVLSSFSVVAKHLGARASTIDLITKRLNQAWWENKGLLST